MVLDMTTSTSGSPSSLKEPTILERTVGEDPTSELVLLLLGCEANAPYGPYVHTATLFLDLICSALEQLQAQSKSSSTSTSSNGGGVKVIIKVYETSQGHFPEPNDYETSNGVILPGSFNSAYDEEPWILELKSVIQNELVANQRPTLGVCFGHQLYAHSFSPHGSAVKCPAGHQGGRKVSTLTKEGHMYLSGKDLPANGEDVNNISTDDPFQLYYTHGDMVEKLPAIGIKLGGTEQVPIQVAMYKSTTSSGDDERPIAVTFQAHPEYGTSRELGLDRTLKQILAAMEERGGLSAEERKEAEADADREFENVKRKSIQTMATVGKLLGWFP